MRWTLLLTASLLTAPPSSSRTDMKMMQPHYLWFTIPISFTGSLDFYAQEGAESLVILNSDFQNRQELGIYAFELPAADVQKLQAEKANANLPALAKPTVLQPNERTVDFAETNDGGAHYDMKCFAGKDMTPELHKLADLFITTALPVLNHPRKVLKGTRLGGKAQLTTREPVSFTVRFSNVGKEPFTVKNPFHPGPGFGENALRLHVRADKPDAALNDSDQLFVDLSANALEPVPAEAKPPSGARVELAPGQSLDVGFRKALKLTPGKYFAAVTFTTSERRGEGIKGIPLKGDLTVDLGKFEVTRAAAKPVP